MNEDRIEQSVEALQVKEEIESHLAGIFKDVEFKVQVENDYLGLPAFIIRVRQWDEEMSLALTLREWQQLRDAEHYLRYKCQEVIFKLAQRRFLTEEYKVTTPIYGN